jgi:hypothetical protein
VNSAVGNRRSLYTPSYFVGVAGELSNGVGVRSGAATLFFLFIFLFVFFNARLENENRNKIRNTNKSEWEADCFPYRRGCRTMIHPTGK